MIVIKSGRHPLVVVLLIVFVLSGMNNLINYNRTASTVLQDLPQAFGYVYYAGLTLGGAITLAGAFWRGLSGPLVERAGYLILAGLWTAFGGLLCTYGWRGLQFAALFLGFAIGAAWRIVQIRRELRVVIAGAVVTGSTEHVEDG